MTNPQDPRANPHRNTALAIPQRDALVVGPADVASMQEPLDESLHLRDLLRIFLKHKWTILAIFLVSALFSVVMTYLASPVYRASTTLQIDRFSPRVLDFKDVSQGETAEYWSDSSDFFATNHELLKSRTVAERAVEELGLRRNPSSLGLAIEPDSAPMPLANSPHLNFLEGIVAWLGRGPDPVAVDSTTRSEDEVIGAFQSSLTVEPVRKSRLVRLHFDSTDPFFAAKAVNTLAQSFISINLERRFEASAYAKTFIEEKLLQTKAKLEDSERELVNFSRDAEIVNIDEKKSIVSQNLQEYSTALVKAEQERIHAEVLLKQVQANPESLALAQENKSLNALKAARLKLEAEYQENLKVYKPAFPKMLQIKGQLDEIDRQMKQALDEIRATVVATYRVASSQESALKKKLVETKQELLALQQRNIRYSILKREVDTSRTLYDGLLQRFKEVGVAGGVGINNISVVDKARVPLAPFKPNLSRNLPLGLAIGLILGLAVAWLMEYFDDSIRFPEDVERETGAAVLGVVPMLKGKSAASLAQIALSPHKDPTSALSESYRSVRTSLQFSTSHGAPRRLVVTSSSKGEGKSTTALSLAINFAEMGKPVLVIDSDLRDPSLHKILDVANSRGLSNYLSGSFKPLEVIRSTQIPNLFVMTSGPLPPNPVELLSSPKLLTLLSECEEHFAHIVVDGPPVLGISDAIVLCNQVDNSIFVIESGKTRKGFARSALKRLQQSGVHPLGVVLTKVDAYDNLYGRSSYYYQHKTPELVGRIPAEG
ncbi:MAG: polysaccharide biosynthesis tyrosine autokinase [Betaproteobacteria bacterium]|nr:polysaccharide biosynthesis tyrosine autokinase [Betaproteobacteria bacterium]